MYHLSDAFNGTYAQQAASAIFPFISPHYFIDESQYIEDILNELSVTIDDESRIADKATALIASVRSSDDGLHMIDLLLLQYSLDTHEGILLMCLAEALMRVPDAETADAFIRDRLSIADWKRHLQQSDSLLVNASTWGLMLSGKVIRTDTLEATPDSMINRLVNKMGEPVIRMAIHQAMKIMAKHFVLGQTIEDAMNNSAEGMDQGFQYSFDMLGEGAITRKDANGFLASYSKALQALGSKPSAYAERVSLSIKLSALHPRYGIDQEQRVCKELYNDVLVLIKQARELDVAITIDAEEADRLEISLKLFKKWYSSEVVKGWGKFGFVVQAYSKRAMPVLTWINALAKEQGDVIPIRLVKGAYWDSEIKLCQQLGVKAYPVFTRKEATDVAYLCCAKYLLSDDVQAHIFPQFASHNAHTIACILDMVADKKKHFEFQRLHGMGDALYDTLIANHKADIRIYAPVGSHKNLLPYLVRRLLENGANSSFVHRLIDAKTPIADLVRHPAIVLKGFSTYHNAFIPLPGDIFGEQRKNSAGLNIYIEHEWLPLKQKLAAFNDKKWFASSIINGLAKTSEQSLEVVSPFDNKAVVGRVSWASDADIEAAISSAHKAWPAWNKTDVNVRAQCLDILADLLENNQVELMALCQREAGKTLQDSIDEIREAVDFCRYYANEANSLFKPLEMPGPTGESNLLHCCGKGVFLCISPWNFPIAIFLGQISAALVTGNTVIVKPAEATSLVAAKVIDLVIEAGVPVGCIQLLLGEGYVLGPKLTSDKRIVGTVFTGSTPTALSIHRSLGLRNTAIATMIAETGGQNTMIVDSTALPEQVVKDVVYSAFASAGQRCSALRVLYLQDVIADKIIALLQGAMAELSMGDPRLLSTDIGPVINQQAQQNLLEYIQSMKTKNQLIAEVDVPSMCSRGTFVAPTAIEIKSINELTRETFGPILHVIRYKASELDTVVDEINATGFGLTLGIHSRNETTAQYIAAQANVGNIYINRNQIGAIVGVQPFGGMGLSGTGPKAGGPHYLSRFMSEKTVTVNTTSMGGNASLLSMDAEDC